MTVATVAPVVVVGGTDVVVGGTVVVVGGTVVVVATVVTGGDADDEPHADTATRATKAAEVVAIRRREAGRVMAARR